MSENYCLNYTYEARSKISNAAIIILDFTSEVDLYDGQVLESTFRDISRITACNISWGTEFLNTRKVVVIISMPESPSLDFRPYNVTYDFRLTR